MSGDPAWFIPGVYRIRAASQGGHAYLQLAPRGAGVILGDSDFSSRRQQWNIDRVKAQPDNVDQIWYSIQNAGLGNEGLHLTNDQQNIQVSPNSESSELARWIFESETPGKCRIRNVRAQLMLAHDSNGGTVHAVPHDPTDVNAFWVCEAVPPSPTLESQFFTLTAEQIASTAAASNDDGRYDIIIVGSGIGGGVLAHDLFDTNAMIGSRGKKVLLLERGNLLFHSHCLNTARPVDMVPDRGGHNDYFYKKFRGEFKFTHDVSGGLWDGGPMYSLGGRSAAWGLFIPRIHEQTLRDRFPRAVTSGLLRTHYGEAEKLMGFSLPSTETLHQTVMDRLNMAGLMGDEFPQHNSGVQWQWGRVASDFSPTRNFTFSQGAYSSIDKILEIVLSPKKKEHLAAKLRKFPRVAGEDQKKFDVVLGAEVRSLRWKPTSEGRAPVVQGVNVRTAQGNEVFIELKQDGKVVLAAGSVNSPTILLRSRPVGVGDDTAWENKIRNHRGLRLTDHDILVFATPFRYLDPADRVRYGGMKLQTYLNLPSGRVALANVSIDSSSYMAWGNSPDDKLPNFIIAFIVGRELDDRNGITINPFTNEPEVTINREPEDPTDVEFLEKFTFSVIRELRSVLRADFFQLHHTHRDLQKVKLDVLGLGQVAHELGTLPMKDPRSQSSHDGCLDDDLQIISEICKNVYVCDLSCFPYSPEVNPSLTLAALAIRLSRHLVPRIPDALRPDPRTVRVVNLCGATVKVRLSNIGKISDALKRWLDQITELPVDQLSMSGDELSVDVGHGGGGARHLWPIPWDGYQLAAGDSKDWKRTPGRGEALFVYKRDQTAGETTARFVTRPRLIVAMPGETTIID